MGLGLGLGLGFESAWGTKDWGVCLAIFLHESHLLGKRVVQTNREPQHIPLECHLPQLPVDLNTGAT